ncbi:MAG: AI-2E family transporter [Armatimonadota bacterium]
MTEKSEPRSVGPSAAAVFVGAVLAIAVCVVLYRIRAVFVPFIIGLLAAYVLDPALEYMERKGMTRTASVWVVVGSFFIFLLILAVAVVPLVVVEVQQLAQNFPDYVAKLEGLYYRAKERLRTILEEQGGRRPEVPSVAVPVPPDPLKTAANRSRLDDVDAAPNLKAAAWEADREIKRAAAGPSTGRGNRVPTGVERLGNRRPGEDREAVVISGEQAEPPGILSDALVGRRVDSLVEQLSEKATQFLPKALARVGAWLWSSLSSVLILIIVPFIAFYFLKDIDPFKRVVLNLLPERRRQDIQTIARQVHQMLSAYLRGLTIVCVLMAIASTAMLYTLSAFFGIQYCLLVGLLTGITYAVPYLGPTTAAVAAGAVGYATADHHAMLCAGLAVGLQVAINQVFDSAVMPRIVGQEVGLHPLLIIFALMAGFQLWGIFGMIVAVPLAASIKISVQQLYPALATATEKATQEAQEHRDDAVGEAVGEAASGDAKQASCD